MFGRWTLPAYQQEIDRVARRVYRVLQMSGYGRIDIRLTDDGTLHVMEANPNPESAMYEDFAEPGQARVDLLGEFNESGLDRLLEEVRSVGDPALLRLVSEYLPISFSRRHGDPSRPWNQFSIRL